MIRLLSFRFHGRSDRLEYWRVQVATLLLVGGVSLAGLLAISAIGAPGGLLFLGYLPLIAISIAVVVRRLHDRGKRGWWWLLFVLVPLMSSQAARELLTDSAPLNTVMALLFELVGGALGLWGLVEIGFLRGRRAPNRYGAYPGTGPIGQPTAPAAASD